MTRITWNEYFLTIAFIVSLRSPDAETRHGCVITSKDNRILSTGYNGFPRGINPDEQLLLPNTRPEKYEFMFHAEANAIANWMNKEKNANAFITGEPCNNCLYTLWQNGVTNIYYDAKYKCRSDATYSSEKSAREKIIKLTGINIQSIDLDYSFINRDTFQCHQKI